MFNILTISYYMLVAALSILMNALLSRILAANATLAPTVAI